METLKHISSPVPQ